MNALAVIFRLLSTLSLAGLAGFIWLQWDTQTSKSHAFMDEVVDDAYTILQSERQNQWDDISKKKSEFYEIFDSNDPVGQNDENPLQEAAKSLKSAEDLILRNPDYRDSLDSLAMEYGAESLIWNSESKKWGVNPTIKLNPPAGFADPFVDAPKKGIKNEAGRVTKGVPRDNRLRTVIGMFYKDRNDKFGELAKLRDNLVTRDIELRDFQNLYAKEKQRKEELEDEVAKITVERENLKADLALEKEKELRNNKLSNSKKRSIRKELLAFSKKIKTFRILTSKNWPTSQMRTRKSKLYYAIKSVKPKHRL